jgi:transcriptional regulator with XRE-family HTH domain
MVESRQAAQWLAKRLGGNIAARRKARRWSQEELAERLGVASETVSRFERGATLPSLLTLQRLGSKLRTPIADLLAEALAAPDDQAATISTWISELPPRDREFLLDLVKTTRDFLRSRR